MMVVPGGLVMSGHHPIGVLRELEELILVIAVHPVVEHKHMVARKE